MSKRMVRVVGGPIAGDEVFVERDKFSVPAHADMAVCGECEPSYPDDPFMHTVDYIVHWLSYGDGRRHYYAAPVGVPIASIMNDLWFEYKTRIKESNKK